MKTLIVGEAVTRHGQSPILYRRLAELCGLTLLQYVDAFERANLIKEPAGGGQMPGGFTEDQWGAALEFAVATWERRDLRRVILLGRAVERAFEIRPQPFFRVREWIAGDESWRKSVVVAPHPSGKSRWWNSPANVEAAREFWISEAKISAG